MESRTSIGNKNFGLSSLSQNVSEYNDIEDYDSWFWESKSQKKLREDTKKAEVERMRAETQAMQQILAEQDNTQSSGMDLGKIALIGGVVILLGIGTVVLLKKKQAANTVDKELVAADLIV